MEYLIGGIASALFIAIGWLLAGGGLGKGSSKAEAKIESGKDCGEKTPVQSQGVQALTQIIGANSDVLKADITTPDGFHASIVRNDKFTHDTLQKMIDKEGVEGDVKSTICSSGAIRRPGAHPAPVAAKAETTKVGEGKKTKKFVYKPSIVIGGREINPDPKPTEEAKAEDDQVVVVEATNATP